MNDTLDILMFSFWKQTKSVQTVSKTVWNCNRDNIVIYRDNITYCPRPGLWSKASCLDLANASPTHRPFLGSSETPKWWTQQTPRKQQHRLMIMQLMCRRLTSWQVYLHACLWVKVHRPNPQTGTQIAYSIQVFFHILPFVMAKPPWPSPELPHYQNLPTVSQPCNPLALHQQLWRYPVVLQSWFGNAVALGTQNSDLHFSVPTRQSKSMSQDSMHGRKYREEVFLILPCHIPWLPVCCLVWFGEYS